MSIEVYEPKGVVEEQSITVDGGFKSLDAFPFKWFSVEVENTGPNQVKVMINDQGLPNATTLEARETRTFPYKRPTIKQVRLYTESGESATVKVTTER